MFKIVLYGSSSDRTQMEHALSEAFKEKNLSFKIYSASNSLKFLVDYLYNNDYQIFVTCIDGQASYIIKTYNNLDIQLCHFVSGSISFPLTLDEIHEKIIKNIELSKLCPYGVYIAKNYNTIHKILHEDIEFIHREKTKSVFYLKNGDTITSSKNIGKIADELNRNYFVKCCKGYLVNIFNIYKVNTKCNCIELHSGKTIPMSKTNFKNFIKSYSFTTLGIDIFND